MKLTATGRTGDQNAGTKRRKLLLETPLSSALLRLAVPITLGNVLQTGHQMTDAFWVGRIGETAVAAVAVSFPSCSLSSLWAQASRLREPPFLPNTWGAGRQDMVDHVAGQTMLMVFVVSALFGGAGYALAPLLLHRMGVAPAVFGGGLGFLRTSFVGIVFVFAYAMRQALMRGIGQIRLQVMIVLGTVILNFALDPLFIFG